MTTVPFTILVDTAEQRPFTFQRIKGDAREGGQLLFIPTREAHLGVHSRDEFGEPYYEPRGDYTIDGLEQKVCVERKSISDVSATLLGWDKEGKTGRRERFEKQLKIMEGFWRSAVIVEATYGDVLREVQCYGQKPAWLNRKITNRTFISWSQRYRVPWYFFDTRRLAEVNCFRILQKAWKEFKKMEKSHG